MCMILGRIMNTKNKQIRENECLSHTEIYTKEKLYDTDTWLKKPIKTIQEIVQLFSEYQELRILDLGCGVGRNSIFLAEKLGEEKACRIDCVDILDIAIDKLNQYSLEYGVSHNINGIVSSIEDFIIQENNYDLILVISALEHIDGEESFARKLEEIKNGLKKNGIVCFVINSNVKEINTETLEEIEPQFEVNLCSEKIQEYLDKSFSGFEIIKKNVVAQKYNIPRGSITSRITTDVITFVAKSIREPSR